MAEEIYCTHRDGITVRHLWSIDELIECTDAPQIPYYRDVNEVWQQFARFYQTKTAACKASLTTEERAYINSLIKAHEREQKAIWRDAS